MSLDPDEYLDPDWTAGGRVHNWRNYIGTDLRAAWPQLSDDLKRVVAENAQTLADAEEWP